MKTVFLLMGAIFALGNSSFAGIKEGGGGDPNEPIFKEIATNIEGWIQSGNADNIQLPKGIYLSDYKQKMLAALSAYHISFTMKEVFVNRKPKTCKNYRDEQNENQILCNSQRFAHAYKNNINDIYRTVHHEFAGLEGLEVNKGQDSDYTISGQISGFLVTEEVKRLPIVKKPATDINGCSNRFVSEDFLLKKLFGPGIGEVKLQSMPVMYAQRACAKLSGCTAWSEAKVADGFERLDFTLYTADSIHLNVQAWRKLSNGQLANLVKGTCSQLGRDYLGKCEEAGVYDILKIAHPAVVTTENCITWGGLWREEATDNSWIEHRFVITVPF